MKKMLFSVIAMVAFTISANAANEVVDSNSKDGDRISNVFIGTPAVWIKLTELIKHCENGAKAAVAELVRLGISDIPSQDGKSSLYEDTKQLAMESCLISKSK